MTPVLLPSHKTVIIGVGLIGGSFALALRAAGPTGPIVGVGRGADNLREALRLGIVDRGYRLDSNWIEEVADAHIVLLATPVAQYPGLLRAIAGQLGAHTVVTDAGSTKQDVIVVARRELGGAFERFVPAHPIAGTEHTGAGAAFSTLFRDRNVVLTPLPETSASAIARVGALWEACGARVRVLEPAAHDRIFAAVSHLPHLLAFALVDAFASRPDAEDIFRYAASGFRDFTRIAAGSPEMWRDISIANRAALLAELDAFRTQLDRIGALLEAGDGAGLEAVYSAASSARRAWGARHGSDRVSIPADGPRES